MTDEAQKIHMLPFVNSAVQFLVRRGLLNDFEIGENIGGMIIAALPRPFHLAYSVSTMRMEL